jgi:hypothetical protein
MMYTFYTHHSMLIISSLFSSIYAVSSLYPGVSLVFPSAVGCCMERLSSSTSSRRLPTSENQLNNNHHMQSDSLKYNYAFVRRWFTRWNEVAPLYRQPHNIKKFSRWIALSRE